MRKTRIIDTADTAELPILSQFEYNLLCLLAEDRDLDYISAALRISLPTVTIGIERILEQLETTTATGAIAKAIRMGIIA